MDSMTVRKPIRFELDPVGWLTVLDFAWRGAKWLWLWNKRRTPEGLFVETSVTFHSELVSSISAEAVIIPAPLPENPTAY